MYWFPAGHLEISSPCLYFSTGLLQTLACRYRWLPYSLPSSNRKMMRPITGATYKKMHSSLVWMGVQFWPSVSFTYYNQSLAYANHNPEPCPGTSKRCWMILCRCCYHWLCSECRLLLQAVSLGWLAPSLVAGEVCLSLCRRTAKSGSIASRGFLKESVLHEGKAYFWGWVITGNPLWSAREASQKWMETHRPFPNMTAVSSLFSK